MEATGIEGGAGLEYGCWGGQFIFVPERKASDLDQLYEAIRQADTWSDFESALPSASGSFSWTFFKSLSKTMSRGRTKPRPTPLLSTPTAFRAIADGDWPAWPAQEMLDWMPEKVKEEYERVDSSVLNGIFAPVRPGAQAGHHVGTRRAGVSVPRRRPPDRARLRGKPGGQHSSIPA